MIGSLVGGIAATFFGQAAIDTAGAFFGCFAFVCGAGVIAPSYRGKVIRGATSLIALLALFGFVVSVFMPGESLPLLSARAKILTPVAQLLGALYALFILPLLVTANVTLDRVWREILALGVIVVWYGALVGIVGFVAGLFGYAWNGLWVGLSVLLVGVLTWLFPWIHRGTRMNKIQAQMVRHLEELSAREKEKP
jgi:hypothetical protein